MGKDKGSKPRSLLVSLRALAGKVADGKIKIPGKSVLKCVSYPAS
jgi:hypothetical protein